MELIGIGIDLVDIARVERMLARHGDRVLRRFLTERERAYVADKARPAMHIAARIAAKEAAYKALQSLAGMRAVGWQDLEVSRQDDGRPYLKLHGLAATVPPGLSLLLSLTHTHGVAGAVAILSRTQP